MPLLSCLSRTWSHIQGTLFPWRTEELGPLTETHKRVVAALEVAGVEAFVRVWPGLPGQPPCDRAALARAFVAKAVISPDAVVDEFAALLASYGITKVSGDKYAGMWPRERFEARNVTYEPAGLCNASKGSDDPDSAARSLALTEIRRTA
jgi:hypothetical protein